MDMSPKEYQEYLKRINPRSPVGKNMVLAFLVGGAICCAGQAIGDWYGLLGLNRQDAATATSITLVPITGFANSVASPAIDFRAEGIVTGTAVKMFTVAGPVIVFGTAASAVYGLILWALG